MRLFRLTCVLAVAVAATACQDRTRTRKIVEPYAIVPGTPTVDTKTPDVLTDPTRATSDFSVNVPRQCDLFQQVSVRKVDILWVVDSSGSMAAKQARLAANFQGFMNQLVNANPPIDFHIAVTSTDTDDAANRGKLRSWTLNNVTEDYISCTPNTSGVGVTCNTGNTTATAVTAFGQMAQVGTSGSSVERGLYSAYLTLNNPLNTSTQAVERFIRPEAALYIVVISDEDDSSCNPLTRQTTCTADPGCRCAAESALSGTGAWGSTAYFTRFFETFKGFGNGDAVAFAAIVASGDDDAGVPSQFGDPNPHVGCCRALDGGTCPSSGTNDGGFEIAYTGTRYAQVAASTGGVTVNICQDDFSGALSSVGYAASGLRTDYRLTRGPDLHVSNSVAQGLTTYVASPTAANCMVDGNCPSGQFCRAQKCARKVEVKTTPVSPGAQYVKCDAAGLRNMVRFTGTSVPEALSTVEICYDVLPTFQNSCP